MPIAPRVARAQPRGDQTNYDEPKPVLLVLRWGGIVGDRAVELVPAHAVGEAAFPGRPANAYRCQWTWAPHGKGSELLQEHWFLAADVLDHQPDADEWREIVARPGWMTT